MLEISLYYLWNENLTEQKILFGRISSIQLSLLGIRQISDQPLLLLKWLYSKEIMTHPCPEAWMRQG